MSDRRHGVKYDRTRPPTSQRIVRSWKYLAEISPNEGVQPRHVNYGDQWRRHRFWTFGPLLRVNIALSKVIRSTIYTSRKVN
jgi:hypothetical protein